MHFSRVFGEALDTEYLTYPVYISYRDTVYDSSQEIIPWEIPLPETNNNTRGGWWKHIMPTKENRKEPRNYTEVDSSNEETLTNPSQQNSAGDYTMSERARQGNSDHVKKILTSHYGVDSTNHDKEAVVQALACKDGAGFYEAILLLSSHKTEDPNDETPKWSEYAKVMTTKEDTQKWSASPCLNDKELVEHAFRQGGAIPKSGKKEQQEMKGKTYTGHQDFQEARSE